MQHAAVPNRRVSFGVDGVLARAARRRQVSIDWHRAASYLDQIASRTLSRRFAWLEDHAGATIPDDVYAHFRDFAKRSGKSFFGPRIPKPGPLGDQDSWQLIVNIPNDEVTESADLARRHMANWTI